MMKLPETPEQELARLEAEVEAAPGWGAAVGAKQERIKGLRGSLKIYTPDDMQEVAAKGRKLLDPDMPTQELKLHMGEMTAQEVRTARAAIRWANSQVLGK
jgi:hypothetical protein